MIQIKIDDSIIDIIDKIEAQTQEDVILDIPLGHPILHNYVSLKILKSKVKERRLVIVTNDRLGRKIGKSLWIEYSSIKNSEFIKQSTQEILLKHNFSYSEFIKFQIKSYIRELQQYLETNKKINTLWKYTHTYKEKSWFLVILGAFFLSLSLLFFIYYFAVTKNYVTISPETNIKKQALNFIFKENQWNNISWNNKNINIELLTKKIELTENYASSWIADNTASLSRGKIRLYNEREEEIALKEKTRVQSASGIVFEIQQSVILPPAVKDNFWKISPWMIETDVKSQVRDIQWNITGSRGNISQETSLILPWLSTDLQKEIYAKSIEDFSGWDDAIQRIVSEDDIQRAKSLFLEKLKSTAFEKVKQDIAQQNTINNTKKEILSGKESIRYSEATIEIEDGIEIWVEKNNFSVRGSIEMSVYVYNKEHLIQRLKTLIYEKNLEGTEKISYVDENSLRMSEIISLQQKPFEMKATFEIEALYLHDFLHKDNTYTEQLKGKIAGLQKDEAIKVLVNDPRISNAEIVIRPFFVDTLSQIQKNIIFEIK